MFLHMSVILFTGESLSRGVSVHGVLFPGGFYVQSLFCVGGPCPGGSLSRGISIQGDLYPGGSVQGPPPVVRILLECILVVFYFIVLI